MVQEGETPWKITRSWDQSLGETGHLQQVEVAKSVLGLAEQDQALAHVSCHSHPAGEKPLNALSTFLLAQGSSTQP